jgi:hypothetical protein
MCIAAYLAIAIHRRAFADGAGVALLERTRNAGCACCDAIQVGVQAQDAQYRGSTPGDIGSAERGTALLHADRCRLIHRIAYFIARRTSRVYKAEALRAKTWSDFFYAAVLSVTADF